MSQHGCPERLSNRSKGFQEEGPREPTMEVLVETLTGTAFEMTVSPSDTIFAIKSKIFRVEGIPVSQQHLLYNFKELEDSSSLRELSIRDGARLRLVLGMRGGPISTRRLPPPPSTDTWRDIERMLDNNTNGCKVTVVVFRDGERVNMLRVRSHHDTNYWPPDNKCSRTTQPPEPSAEQTVSQNAVTMGKMVELRRRMENLSLRRARDGDKPEIQKTRSEETLSVASLLDDDTYKKGYAPYSEAEDTYPVYDGSYTRYEYDCYDRYTLLPPIGSRTNSDNSVSLEETGEGSLTGPIIEETYLDSEQCIPQAAAADILSGAVADYSPVVGGACRAWRACGSSPQLSRPPPLPPRPRRLDLAQPRLLPALSRHRNREHLHLSDEGLHVAHLRHTCTERQPAAAVKPSKEVKEEKRRVRCSLCSRRLSIATVHTCRCGAAYCAPHRYAEVHGCAYDYKAAAAARLRDDNPRLAPPKLPDI